MSAIEDNQTRSAESDTNDTSNVGEFERLKRDIKDAERARAPWRKEARRAFNFVASRQWAEDDLTLLNAQNRPAITFNRCAPIIKAVCGLEVNNRQGVIYLPREQGDSGPNELITSTGRWIRDECNAEDEESEAFKDLAISGEGWTETRMDFDIDPKGQPVIERIDSLEMGVNKGASRANYQDARMIYRIRDMDPEDVRALLELDASIIDEALHARWLDEGVTPADGGEGNKRDYPDSTREGVGSQGLMEGRRKTVKIIQCQYWRREPMHMVATPDDAEVQEMTPENFAKFEERIAAMNEQGAATAAMTGEEFQPMEYTAANVTKKVFYECFIGSNILDTRPLKIGFQFKAMTGERDREKNCFYGMLRDMFDPQMWANKWLSQTMHVMNSNAKGGLLAETDAFVNVRKAQRDWADNSKIVWVKPGSLQKQKIKERQLTPLPPGLDSLMMFAISSIRDVTGVNLELLGQADREQAASLEAQRRQSAMTVLASMFDSLRRYRKDQGRLTLQFIELLPDNTLIRVNEKGLVKYIPLVKQGVNFSKFDVIIDEAPTSPDQKQAVWAITSQILQMNVLPPAAVLEMLKYSPYPESVVQEIRKALGMDGEMPASQLAEKLKQAEGALQFMEQKLREQMEVAKDAEDDKAIEMLKLEIDEYKAETERLSAQWDAHIKAAGVAAGAEERTEGEGGGQQVTSGAQQLPAIGAQTPAASGALEQKVDMLMNMMQQFVGGQQPAEPVPSAEPAPPMEPSFDGVS